VRPRVCGSAWARPNKEAAGNDETDRYQGEAHENSPRGLGRFAWWPRGQDRRRERVFLVGHAGRGYQRSDATARAAVLDWQYLTGTVLERKGSERAERPIAPRNGPRSRRRWKRQGRGKQALSCVGSCRAPTASAGDHKDHDEPIRLVPLRRPLLYPTELRAQTCLTYRKLKLNCIMRLAPHRTRVKRRAFSVPAAARKSSIVTEGRPSSM
jgi:hypothetical protein